MVIVAVASALLTVQVGSLPDRAGCPPVGAVERMPDGRPATLVGRAGLRPDFSRVLLPTTPWQVRIEMRVDEAGRVTGVCVGGPPSTAIERAIVNAALQLKFEPAVDQGRPVATIVSIPYEIIDPRQGVDRGLIGTVERSNDVPWLELIASSATAARDVQRQSRVGMAKMLRVAAYARLGEIGTAQSLAAVDRIEKQMAGASLTPVALRLDSWPTVGWHMGDMSVTPLATVVGIDGTTYAVVGGSLFGGRDYFLIASRAPDDPDSWSRPKLIGPMTGFPKPGDSSLIARGPRTLTLHVADKEWPLVLDDIERDSDGDGWTDLEEGRLGTNPHAQDSDGDGVSDGRDVCPLEAAATVRDESSFILQKAVFGAFALTGSRQLLFATPQTPRVCVAGYGGPILLDRAIPETADGGTYVSWKIVEKTTADAVVEITDWEGRLAAGGQHVFLKKIAGTWVVVAVRGTWVS